MVQIGGRWTAVEAKFDVAHERNLGAQLRKYVAIDACRVGTGPHSGQSIHGPWADLCLVVDRHGLYVANRSGLIDGFPGAPAWARTQLTPDATQEIRQRLGA